MNRIKYILFLFLAAGFAQTGSAQQLTNSSYFMFNEFLFNPAVAGSEDNIPVFASVRRQWVQIEEAPSTQILGAHAYSGSFVGIGTAFYNDVAGPSRRTGLGFSAARHFQVMQGNESWLSLGLSANLFQYSFDESKLHFDQANDPVLGTAMTSRLVPDASFGAYCYAEHYDVGFSIQNLAQTKVNLFDIENLVQNQMIRTYYLSGTYDFIINDQFYISPSGLVKYVRGAPVQADVAVLFHFLDMFWAGPGFRSLDAVYLMAGVKYSRLSFGYAFDYSFTPLRDYNTGTHELSELCPE